MRTGTGKGGKPHNDRELAGRVRDMALNQILEILSDRSEANNTERLEFLKRLAPNLLPRLNEHSGPDGEPIPILNAIPCNDSNSQNTETKE